MVGSHSFHQKPLNVEFECLIATVHQVNERATRFINYWIVLQLRWTETLAASP